MPYIGPLRNEPLPVELHNTLYAVRGQAVDGLADERGLRAWLAGLDDRLPVAARTIDVSRLHDFHALRTSVREALHATLERRAVSADSVTALNHASADSPESIELRQRGQKRESQFRHHAASATDAALGAIAASTIALVGGPDARDLRACDAPGCVLLFLKDHPRREWCSTACGNRARQARHYKRSRKRSTEEPA